VVIRHGATITGRLTVPTTAAPAGWSVAAIGQTTGTRVTATTDGSGTYRLVGLATDVYRLDVTPPTAAWPGGRTPVPTVWDASVTAETDTTAAQQLTPSTQYVHTTYDLELDVTAPADTPFTGATMAANSAGTPVATTQAADAIGTTHRFDAIVPTGDYTLAVTFPAAATTPARTLWYSTFFSTLTGTATYSTSVSVAYPFLAERSSTLD
jgi:hypothetical protein